ncbi:phosphatase PAP2 family protein [Halalkalibacter sp. APA_J-10(15)]|uniref:phosphatase PAP2 family protein n=1 Tax=unclassified Halalkalibacter TaxID=2893063 RepID=UPI001FF27944|nr:phosphatase PAP2 family protein [Halalkalibacter sp. APA_J-10(15)]MCK0471251.1 phosphatase PAP2 family protein [Halalkalibacter sp. APA_J-10(15)]
MYRQRLYETDCSFFHFFNQQNYLTSTMKYVTHFGGASFTILFSLSLSIFASGPLQRTGWIALFALIVSHTVVSLIKKRIPRNRPYLVLPNVTVVENPFKDHSFPSGHTTAIFAIIVPFMISYPILILPLFFAAALVGLSRIVLGLHYPSDVLAGAILGTVSAFGSYTLMIHLPIM